MVIGEVTGLGTMPGGKTPFLALLGSRSSVTRSQTEDQLGVGISYFEVSGELVLSGSFARV